MTATALSSLPGARRQLPRNSPSARRACLLATLLQVPQGSQVAVVVLGASNSATRFWEARHLFNWVVSRGQGIVGGDPKTPNK